MSSGSGTQGCFGGIFRRSGRKSKPKDKTSKTGRDKNDKGRKENANDEATRQENESENRQQLKEGEQTIPLECETKSPANDTKTEPHVGEQDETLPREGTSSNFGRNRTFMKSIRTKAAKKESKPIFGLAVLDSELFIITQDSIDVEVYDATKAVEFKRQFQIKDLFDPIDIRSCKRNKCLYIFDWGEESSNIFKIDREGKLIHKWSTDNDGGFLSVTDDANVLLTVWNKNALHEYSPTGQLIREIKLESSITQLRLGSKLNDGLFLISHGEAEDREHRVCIVNEAGTVCKSIGDRSCPPECQFNGPNYFAVDRSGAVLVADQNNKRVVILTSDLEFQKELITETDGLRHPVRLELDQTTGRLFVVDNNWLSDRVWKDGKISVFDINTL